MVQMEFGVAMETELTTCRAEALATLDCKLETLWGLYHAVGEDGDNMISLLRETWQTILNTVQERIDLQRRRVEALLSRAGRLGRQLQKLAASVGEPIPLPDENFSLQQLITFLTLHVDRLHKLQSIRGNSTVEVLAVSDSAPSESDFLSDPVQIRTSDTSGTGGEPCAYQLLKHAPDIAPVDYHVKTTKIALSSPVDSHSDSSAVEIRTIKSVLCSPVSQVKARPCQFTSSANEDEATESAATKTQYDANREQAVNSSDSSVKCEAPSIALESTQIPSKAFPCASIESEHMRTTSETFPAPSGTLLKRSEPVLLPMEMRAEGGVPLPCGPSTHVRCHRIDELPDICLSRQTTAVDGAITFQPEQAGSVALSDAETPAKPAVSVGSDCDRVTSANIILDKTFVCDDEEGAGTEVRRRMLTSEIRWMYELFDWPHTDRAAFVSSDYKKCSLTDCRRELRRLRQHQRLHDLLMPMVHEHQLLTHHLIHLDHEQSDSKRLVNRRGSLLMEQRHLRELQHRLNKLNADIKTHAAEYLDQIGRPFIVRGQHVLQYLDQLQFKQPKTAKTRLSTNPTKKSNTVKNAVLLAPIDDQSMSTNLRRMSQAPLESTRVSPVRVPSSLPRQKISRNIVLADTAPADLGSKLKQYDNSMDITDYQEFTRGLQRLSATTRIPTSVRVAISSPRRSSLSSARRCTPRAATKSQLPSRLPRTPRTGGRGTERT